MIRKGPVLTKHIGFRVRDEVYSRFEQLADIDSKPVNEWCRERLLKMMGEHPATLAEQALLAEIAVSREITINLLFAFARDGSLPEQKVREIIARGEDKKYERVYRLLKQAGAAHATHGQPPAERSTA